MTWTLWDQVRRAAQLFAAAAAARDFQARVNLQRAACDLLRHGGTAGADQGPSWADVLMAHGR